MNEANPLWVYYNNSMILAMKLCNRLEQGHTLTEDEALMYCAVMSLNARVCQQLERTIFPQETKDGE